MAVSLGKRKRRSHAGEQQHSSEDEADFRARFQQAFEAKFRPLEKKPSPPSLPEESQPDEDETGPEQSDWSGFSAEDDDVEVVAHQVANGSLPDFDRTQQRAFMSSKPPTSESKPRTSTAKLKTTEEDDVSEVANTKNDLALQRLLKESHLLDPSTFNSQTSSPQGKGRLKALDLRLQGLGAKTSLSTQDKMPIAHRKGIQSKAVNREEKRRKDAAENGVVLERARHAAKDLKRRERSVGGPTVGRFRGGTLKLSGRDLRDIQGPRKQVKGKKGR